MVLTPSPELSSPVVMRWSLTWAHIVAHIPSIWGVSTRRHVMVCTWAHIMALTPSVWGVFARLHTTVWIWAHIMAHTPSVWGVSARRHTISSAFIEDDSCGSKILYHHVDLGEITATDLIEKENCGALFHLIFYVWSFYVFLLDSFTHTNSLLVSSPFIIGGRTLLIWCFCNSSSFHLCMHWKGPRLLSLSRAQEASCCTQLLHSLCSELHLEKLLLLAPVVLL